MYNSDWVLSVDGARSFIERTEVLVDKFIPYEKLSKKKKREQDLRQRRTWGDLNPVTRRSPKPTVYNRNKARNWKEDSESVPLFMSAI